jgi:hypothetical protein
MRAVPELIDPVLAKISPKRSFSLTENERFGLVFANTGSIISGTGAIHRYNNELNLKVRVFDCQISLNQENILNSCNRKGRI